ncbi:MAG TPA: hypothetical protein VJ063_19740 [Verrucomicrobiae bacterium]|nr:hypothetical protein [Verrucomicrobiae bacterium]
MAHEQLIAKALEHANAFERGTSRLPGAGEFPDVTLRETVIVYFRRGDRDDHIEVYLDRKTGDFIGAVYAAGKTEVS